MIKSIPGKTLLKCYRVPYPLVFQLKNREWPATKLIIIDIILYYASRMDSVSLRGYMGMRTTFGVKGH